MTHQEKRLPRFEAAVFDMDGLLLDTERIALDTFRATCRSFELGEHLDVFYRCIGTNTTRGREVIEEGLGALVDCGAFWRQWDVLYKATTLESAALKPGARELLSELSRRGLPMAVATSTSTAQAIQKLERAGIHLHFRAIVGGDQVAHSKPHPDIYLRAAGVLGVAPGWCLALEDSANGVRAATAAGMIVVQVPDLVPPSDDLLQLGHYVFESLQHVYAVAFPSGN